MIGYIEGKIMSARAGSLVIMTGAASSGSGVGYTVGATEEITSRAVVGSDISLWIHTAVRENSIDLYGFPAADELALFELLITISGIGPKTALNIMNAAPAATLRRGIVSGDPEYLAKIPGIGNKKAQAIVRELADKVATLSLEVGDGHETMAHASKAAREENDALEALRGLGWNEREVRAALAQVMKENRLKVGGVSGTGGGKDKPLSASEQVREAIKILGRS